MTILCIGDFGSNTVALRLIEKAGSLEVLGISLVLIVNASARPPRLAGLPTVGTCNYRYTGI